MTAPCNITHKFGEESLKLLRELNSNRYVIADVTVQVPSTPDRIDQERAELEKELFRMKTPVCEVIKKIDRNESRYPIEINYVVLRHHIRDKAICRPVRRTVTYFERKSGCHKQLNKKLFSKKVKKFEVAFEAMKIKT